MEQDFTELIFPETVNASRSLVGDGYKGAYEVVRDWHAESGHLGHFNHCHTRPCFDVVRGRTGR